MKSEVQLYAEQLEQNYIGEPWFGRNIQTILSEVSKEKAMQKPSGQHSILELLYHMINWRLFTISRLEKNATGTLYSFEENDWQQLDHNDKSLWQKGLDKLLQTQEDLTRLLQAMKDEELDNPVKERAYTNRELINGIIQHDIYHLGQIAYINKLLS